MIISWEHSSIPYDLRAPGAAALAPAVVRPRAWTVAILAVTDVFNYPDLGVRGHPAACGVAWADSAAVMAHFDALTDSLARLRPARRRRTLGRPLSPKRGAE
jgi:hypothetical protein